MKLILTFKTQLLFMCFLIFFSSDLISQCSSSPTTCQPTANGHGPDPCDAKIYCSNSGVIEQGLIACTPSADTDGCGVEANNSNVTPSIDITLFQTQNVPHSCYIDPNTNNQFTYVQWIKFATPPEKNTFKIQGSGQMNAWVVFYAGSEANTPPYQLNGCTNLQYVDGACSELNQYKIWTNTNAIIDPNVVNVYYIALLYDAPSNGSINFKVKGCEYTQTCEPEITCPDPSPCLTTPQQVEVWYNSVSYGSCGAGAMVSANPSLAVVGECTSQVVFTLVDTDGNPILNNGVVVSCTSTVNIDMTDPELVDVDDYTLTGCNTPWPAYLSTSWTDNCSTGGITNSDAGVPDGTSTDGCIQYRLFTFSVTDDCGNSDTETT